MTRTIAVSTLLALCWMAPLSAWAQQAEVRSTVDDFLVKLGNLDAEALSNYFTNDAVLIVARLREGEFINTVETADKWLDKMRNNPNPAPFEERLSNVEITIDSGELAYLRADFEIVQEGKVVSYGMDVFTLLRSGAEWKIAAIAYTNLPKQ